jgi:hypothetical protein
MTIGSFVDSIVPRLARRETLNTRLSRQHAPECGLKSRGSVQTPNLQGLENTGNGMRHILALEVLDFAFLEDQLQCGDRVD